jgi:agmatine deiminase
MHMPAEWEAQTAVWFGWEEEYHSCNLVSAEIIKIIANKVQVKISVPSDSVMSVAEKFMHEQGIDTSMLEFLICPGDRFWIRDYGPIFLIDDKGKLGATDFVFDANGNTNWYKEKYNNNNDSVAKYLKSDKLKITARIDSLIAVYEQAQIRKSDLIHEGGAMEVNGKGTLILCESTVFQRNPERSKEDVEQEFKEILGIKKIIWMKQGLADDPKGYFRRIFGDYIGGGVGGHVDEFVRFIDPNTILLAWVDEKERYDNPINEINYERLSENYKIIQNSTDQDGNPFKIIKVPLPDLIEKKVGVRSKIDIWYETYDVAVGNFKESEAPAVGDTVIRVPASSYLNFFLTNGLVILPKYSHIGSSPEKEETVKKIFEEYYPDRKIVFIDVMTLNWWGGGIHCITQQQPVSTRKINR